MYTKSDNQIKNRYQWRWRIRSKMKRALYVIMLPIKMNNLWSDWFCLVRTKGVMLKTKKDSEKSFRKNYKKEKEKDQPVWVCLRACAQCACLFWAFKFILTFFKFQFTLVSFTLIVLSQCSYFFLISLNVYIYTSLRT